ncbi:MAG: hypothetical protein ABIJ56_21515 [Pseudomonadota bacterium]
MRPATIWTRSIPLAACLTAGCVLDMDPADMPPPGDALVEADETADAPADPDVVDAPLDPGEPDAAPPDSAPDITPDLDLDVPDAIDVPDLPDFPEIPDPDVIDTPVEEAPPPGSVGAACDTGPDCTPWSGLEPVCQDNFGGIYDLPGGYCTAECTDPGDCGSGADCVLLLGMGYCLRTCTDTAQCRVEDGYECRTIPLIGGDTYCLPSSW